MFNMRRCFMKRSKKRIAVIGSGITGLTAAYRIKKKIEEENLPFELLVLESSATSGGNIFTMELGKYFFDLGVNSIDTRQGEALNLIEELGLKEKLMYSRNGKEDLYLFNKLYHFDFPTYKGLPNKLSNIWKYDCLSLNGKLAFLRDAYLPVQPKSKKKVLESFLKQRIGKEMTEHIAEPYFSKINVGDIARIGIGNIKEPLSTLVKKHGSITKSIAHHPELLDTDGNYATFEKGLQVLTNKLADELKGYIDYNRKVTNIKADVQGTYVIDINHTHQVRVGAIIVASGPSSYPNLFEDEQLEDWFSETNVTSVGHLLFSFPHGSIKRMPKGFGILTPRRSNTYVTSIHLLNRKWSFYGNDKEYVSVSFGRKGESYLMSLSNKQLEESILKEVQEILEISADPLFRIVKRWPNSVPQYTEFSNDTNKQISEYFDREYPGIYLGGNGFDGYGISQCIKQANEMSERAIHHIKQKEIKNDGARLTDKQTSL